MEVSFTIPIQLVYLSEFLWETLPGVLLALWCSGALVLTGLTARRIVTEPRMVKSTAKLSFIRLLMAFTLASFVAFPAVVYESIKDILKKLEHSDDQ